MPASTIVVSNGQFRLYGDSVQTFDRLPVATYVIEFSKLTGYSLREVAPLTQGDEVVYGSHPQRVDRIVRGYQDFGSRSMGVLLSGDKGMGKSLLVRMLAERARNELGLPTVLVQHATPGLASFLDDLGEVTIVFDEFEKVFDNDNEDGAQSQFLPLFDGLSLTKRLYVISVNHLSRVNEFLLNRPGRLHYHMRFAYPDPATVAAYLRDQVPGIVDDEVNAVVDFSRKYDLNFDHLRAISFELCRKEAFADVIGDLNIKRTERNGASVTIRLFWENGDSIDFFGDVDLFDHDSVQGVSDYRTDSGLRFRMCDAVSTPEGYHFSPDAFEFIDARDDDEKKTNELPIPVYATMKRVHAPRLDF